MTSFHTASQTIHKISKRHCFQENHKILKAIQNKINPFNVNPKVKLKLDWQKESGRPTFHNFSYKGTKEENSIRNEEEYFIRGIWKKDERSFLSKSFDGYHKAETGVKSVKVRQLHGSEIEIMNESQKIKIYRLPALKKDLEKKKYELAKMIQSNSLEFQRDSFRPLEEQTVCNLEYLINRINVSNRKSKVDGRKQQPLRGYENLSPNRLKEYIEMFKHKMKSHPQSIYVSKKRIALPKNNTEEDEQEENLGIKFKSIDQKNQKKIGKISRKQISSKKGSRKSISRKSISRKSIVSKHQIKRISEKKKTLK